MAAEPEPKELMQQCPEAGIKQIAKERNNKARAKHEVPTGEEVLEKMAMWTK